MMKKLLACALLSAFSVQAQTGPVWQPHVDIEAKPGTKRNVGEADFFLPVWQDGKGLLFGNARLRVADHDNREGNLGLGYRRMLEGGWNFGGYGYYDRRRSTTGNYFNQVTLGAEALGRDWDFRGNVYLPQGDKVRDLGGTTTVGGGASTAAIVGTTIQVTTPGSTTFTSQERALKGYDVEAGWRAPVWAADADKQLRLYAGGYHFSDAGIRVSGPRVRAELTMAELSSLWKGAQLILGAEYQDDNARGGQAFVSARLRIPLGSDKNTGYKMNWQERRMAAPVVRDVDVVTQSRAVAVASTPATVETATTTGGQAITVLDSGTTTGAALPGAVAAAGANSTVVLKGTFNTSAITTLQTGQTLMGAGTLSVATPSGRTATLAMPGATITGAVAGTNPAVLMGDNSTLTGMTVTNLSTGGGVPNPFAVRANNVTGAIISNNTLSGIENLAGGTAQGLLVFGSTNISVLNNNLSGTGTGIGVGLNVVNSTGILVVGNTMNAAGNSAGNSRAIVINNGSFAAGSTGNTMQTGICSVPLAGTGSIGLVGGGTCP